MYPISAGFVLGLDIASSVIAALGCIGNVFVMMVISKWKNISSGAACMFSLAMADFLAIF